jgi:hypothetical protein
MGGLVDIELFRKSMNNWRQNIFPAAAGELRQPKIYR